MILSSHYLGNKSPDGKLFFLVRYSIPWRNYKGDIKELKRLAKRKSKH